MPPARGHRYAAWIDRWRIHILLVSLGVAITGGWLAAQLSLRSDLANLLPPSARSVQDLEALKKRARAFGTVFLVVESKDPDLRRRTAQSLHGRLQRIDPELVAHIDYDDTAAREYVWNHRFLFTDLADLTEARDAIRERINTAKLDANPLFVDLDDEEPAEAGAALDERIDKLRERLDDAERQINENDGFLSHDGELQLVIVRSTFPSSDGKRGKQLVTGVHAAVAQTQVAMGPGVQIGITGDVVTLIDEQRSVMRGLWMAALITVILCAAALFLYFRSLLPVAAVLWSLAVGTLATFGVAMVLIGHLNMVTAFLAAIVVGNGINAGLILLARYFEEVRAGRSDHKGLGDALDGAARGTLAASLTAGAAYGSLIVTDFHGFRHFGIIGAIGMVLCWIAAFTVLPAALCVLRRHGRIRSTRAPAVGPILACLVPRRLGRIAAAGALLTIAAGVVSYDYIASDPMQEDWSDLRPRGKETRVSVEWKDRIERSFDKRFSQDVSGPFAVALDRREDVPAVVERLRTLQGDHSLLGFVHSLDTLLPTEQERKLEVLDEIRRSIDSDLAEELEGEDQALLARLRPPEGLRELTDADIPPQISWMFTEQDGTRGRLIMAGRGEGFDSWNVRHWQEVAHGVRGLDLPEDAVLGGKAFVFSDMIEAMETDGPKATVVALLGAFLCVWLIVGLRRHGVVTLICGLSGIIGMVALVALWGLKVNVIDFIALPITVGIGIDYAVNICARDRDEPGLTPRQLLSTTGGAVLLCSFTTIVGYGSLLLSDSGGIRSFGLAAILGEFACLVAALTLAPALLSLFRGVETAKARLPADLPAREA